MQASTNSSDSGAPEQTKPEELTGQEKKLKQLNKVLTFTGANRK